MSAPDEATPTPVTDLPERPRQGDVLGEESGLPESKSDEPEGNEPEGVGKPDELDFNELDPNAKDRTWGA